MASHGMTATMAGARRQYLAYVALSAAAVGLTASHGPSKREPTHVPDDASQVRGTTGRGSAPVRAGSSTAGAPRA